MNKTSANTAGAIIIHPGQILQMRRLLLKYIFKIPEKSSSIYFIRSSGLFKVKD